MQIFTGQALHKQITIGNLHFFHRLPPKLQMCSKQSPQEEEERYLAHKERRFFNWPRCMTGR